jgi:hypothetical protein
VLGQLSGIATHPQGGLVFLDRGERGPALVLLEVWTDSNAQQALTTCTQFNPSCHDPVALPGTSAGARTVRLLRDGVVTTLAGSNDWSGAAVDGDALAAASFTYSLNGASGLVA